MTALRLLLMLPVLGLSFSPLTLHAEEKEAEKVITPGKVIVPFETMRRMWGELVSVDLETRTGTFRSEGDGKIYSFAVMPYAEMLHHATNGELADFKIGERAIFRLHPNQEGQWYWLTYIQDEMNMLRGHKEYFFVESIDPEKKRVGFTWAKGDKSFIRQEGLFLDTDNETKFWKNGKPATFADIKLGDKLRTKTHGVGEGKTRVAWHVFLDDESLEAFRDEQIAVHAARIAKEGAPGYIDLVDGGKLELTMFREGGELTAKLMTDKKKPSVPPVTVKVAPTDASLKPTAEPILAKVISCEKAGGGTIKLVLETDGDTSGFQVTKVARVWLVE